MPAGFVQRLGPGRGDLFFSGTYTSGGKRIGFIRIGDFAPVEYEFLGTALRQFDGEIRFFQQNTDGLVVDVMRNPGGFGCYAESLLTWLIPYRFRSFGAEVRATWEWVTAFDQSLEDAEASGAEQWEIDLLADAAGQVRQAYQENRGRTGPIPLCGPSLDVDPASAAYTKPIMLLADEFTTSAGDIFAAIFQDAGRGPVGGWRTAGAGGNIATIASVGFYAEAGAAVTQSMVTRARVVEPPGFPASHYIENAGVHPDVLLDYMTMDNLVENGRPFVEACTAKMAELIEHSAH
jgi:C-terminal processing protease CtpA/Prc